MDMRLYVLQSNEGCQMRVGPVRPGGRRGARCTRRKAAEHTWPVVGGQSTHKKMAAVRKEQANGAMESLCIPRAVTVGDAGFVAAKGSQGTQ